MRASLFLLAVVLGVLMAAATAAVGMNLWLDVGVPASSLSSTMIAGGTLLVAAGLAAMPRPRRVQVVAG